MQCGIPIENPVELKWGSVFKRQLFITGVRVSGTLRVISKGVKGDPSS